MFDGVSLVYRRVSRNRKVRQHRGGTKQEMFMRKAQVVQATQHSMKMARWHDHTSLLNLESASRVFFAGASAHMIGPAIEAAVPPGINFEDFHSLHDMAAHDYSVTVQLFADKGSGNMLWYKKVLRSTCP